MQEGRLTHNVYAWSQSLAEVGMNNWVRRTNLLLSHIGDHSGLSSTDELWEALARIETQN